MFACSTRLTLIWVDFLGVRFVLGGNIGPSLKLVRIMLEVWNLVRKYAHILDSGYITFSIKTPSILLMPALFCKRSTIFGKNSTFTQSNSMRVMLDLCSVFGRQKVTLNENVSFKDHVLGSRSPDCSKVGINWKNDITIFWHDFIVIFLMFPHFSCQVQLLVQVSCQYHYWF